MSRPRKDGVDYFPFDVDFFSDDKIRSLKARHGCEGVTVYLYFLCEIYRQKGYYIEFGEDTDYIIAAELGISFEKFKEIRTFLLDRSLFDSPLFKTRKIITSKGVQRRYQQAIKSRALKKTVAVSCELWLLSEEETEAFIEVRSSGFSGNNPDKSEIYATKQSKEKHSKEKESTAQQSTEEECAAAPSNAEIAFSAIKKPSIRDQIQLNRLKEQYGERALLFAINDAANKGGKSIEYVAKILEDINQPKKQPAPQESSFDESPYNESGYAYKRTYDIKEMEDFFWNEDLEDIKKLQHSSA